MFKPLSCALLVAIQNTLAAQPPDSIMRVAGRLGAGENHTCAVSASEQLYCWGNNRSEQLGVGRPGAPERYPQRVVLPGGKGALAVTAGQAHTCALDVDGTAYCWGEGKNGALGYGQTKASGFPVAVLTSEKFTAIAAGDIHTCAVSNSGTAYCWGLAEDGRLGIDSIPKECESNRCLVPQAVTAPEPLQWIASGSDFTCGLSATELLYCWGKGADGRLGVGSNENRWVPTLVTSSIRFRFVSLGGRHGCAVSEDGTGHCWGYNLFGAVGDGKGGIGRRQLTPVPIRTPEPLVSILAKYGYGCGVGVTGTISCWGETPAEGAFGSNTSSRTQRKSPELTFAGPAGPMLTGGRKHICANQGPILRCWGENLIGQLGVGSQDPVITIQGSSLGGVVPILRLRAP